MVDELYSFLSLCVIAATIQQLLKFRQLLYLICHAVRIREELEAIITSLHAQLKSNLQSTRERALWAHTTMYISRHCPNVYLKALPPCMSQATASHQQHELALI